MLIIEIKFSVYKQANKQPTRHHTEKISRSAQQQARLKRKESVTYFFELFTDHCEGFEDGVGGAGDGDDSLRTRRVRDIDFGTALKMENNR